MHDGYVKPYQDRDFYVLKRNILWVEILPNTDADCPDQKWYAQIIVGNAVFEIYLKTDQDLSDFKSRMELNNNE